jgi:hypothetical protein
VTDLRVSYVTVLIAEALTLAGLYVLQLAFL